MTSVRTVGATAAPPIAALELPLLAGWASERPRLRAAGPLPAFLLPHSTRGSDGMLAPVDRHVVLLGVAIAGGKRGTATEERWILRRLDPTGGSDMSPRLKQILRHAEAVSAGEIDVILAQTKAMLGGGFALAEIVALTRLAAYATFEANVLAETETEDDLAGS